MRWKFRRRADSTTWKGKVLLPDPTSFERSTTMANLQNDQDDESLPQPATPVALDSNSTPRQRKAVNDAHHQELAGHLIDNSIRAGHGGHMLGKQGPKGHDMPPNDLHLQAGSYIPRGVMSKLPTNTENTSSENGSADANPQGSDDYGSVDKG